MEKKVCSDCQSCNQYFTGDSYPLFGCKKGKILKEDEMGYPSNVDGCNLWEQNTRELWTE